MQDDLKKSNEQESEENFIEKPIDQDQENPEPEIDEATKRELIRNFFHYDEVLFPSLWEFDILVTYISVALGIFIVFYFNPSFPTYLIAAVALAVGFYFALRWIEPYYKKKREYSKRPTPELMQYWLVDDIKNIIKPAAKDLLSIPSSVPDENYIIIPYPIFWEQGSIPEDALLKGDVGGSFIYSAYRIQILVVAESFISLYTCDYNWVENSILNAQTQEFFFEDISSINTATESLEYKIFDERDKEDAPTVGNVPVIIIHNKGNEEMKVIVDIPALNVTPKIRQNTIRIMQVLRILLRNRRAGEIFD